MTRYDLIYLDTHTHTHTHIERERDEARQRAAILEQWLAEAIDAARLGDQIGIERIAQALETFWKTREKLVEKPLDKL